MELEIKDSRGLARVRLCITNGAILVVALAFAVPLCILWSH